MSENPAETIVDRVRAEMTAQLISGTRLARQMGVTQQYLSRRLTGEVEFRASDLEVIAACLRVPVEQFLRAPASAP